jgi:hypothetical protein
VKLNLKREIVCLKILPIREWSGMLTRGVQCRDAVTQKERRIPGAREGPQKTTMDQCRNLEAKLFPNFKNGRLRDGWLQRQLEMFFGGFGFSRSYQTYTIFCVFGINLGVAARFFSARLFLKNHGVHSSKGSKNFRFRCHNKIGSVAVGR